MQVNNQTELNNEEPANIQFPYEYKPVHPQLHQYRQRSLLFKLIFKPIITILKPILLPIRLLLTFTFLFLHSCVTSLCNMGTDQTKPLPKLNRFIFLCSAKFFCTLATLSQGFVVKTVKKSKETAPVVVLNHRSMIDILMNGLIGTETIIGKASMTNNFITGPTFNAGRSIKIIKNQSALQIIKDRFESGVKWPALTLYAEGTVTSFGVILRLRTGSFRLGLKVQPVVFNYFYSEPFEWLFETAFEHLMQAGNNLCGKVEVSYLDPMEQKTGEWPRQFADRVGKAMADEIGSVYVPYQSEDVYYFNGKGDISKCTEEYIRDYGWMGTLKDYKKMCKKAGLNWRYEWPKERFANVE
ncbi:Lysophospholipid_acyltransferase [Hexamita inflata]|uniref:Lysophospholipid acyltransferase n=1 Tax=Hexamita inflata TaxID=28002 RepID=A0AA86NF31_9EUKA|nr:Lysophospholipid acyltransferase [Hexamita inflata]